MYIFIAIIFVAELIIALQLIFFIRKADKKILDINDCVKEFNPLAKTFMQYVRCVSTDFSKKIKSGIDFVKKQNEKMIIKTVTSVAIYTVLIFFRMKKLKAKRIYNLIGAIRDVALELAI